MQYILNLDDISKVEITQPAIEFADKLDVLATKLNIKKYQIIEADSLPDGYFVTCFEIAFDQNNIATIVIDFEKAKDFKTQMLLQQKDQKLKKCFADYQYADFIGDTSGKAKATAQKNAINAVVIDMSGFTTTNQIKNYNPYDNI